MALIDSLRSVFGRGAPAQEQERIVHYGGVSDSFSRSLARTSSTTRRQAIETEFRGWVATAINKNARRVSRYVPYAVRCTQSSGKITRTRDDSHALSQLLWRPNPYYTGSRLMYEMTQSLQAAGEAFCLIERDEKGLPAQLWPVRADRMREVPDADQYLLGWVYTPLGSTKEYAYLPEDVLHITLPSLSNPLRGASPIEQMAYEVDTDRAVAAYGRTIVQSGGRVDLHVTTESEDADEIKRFREQIEALHSRATRGSRVLATGKGVDVKPLNLKPTDLEYLGLAGYNRKALLAALGSSDAVLGLTEDANRASSSTVYLQWNRDTIDPLLSLIAEAIGHKLLPQFEGGRQQLVAGRQWIEVGYDSPVPEDAQAKAKEDSALVKAGIKSLNEARAERGLPPIPGCDEPWLSKGSLPVSLLLAQAASGAATEDEDEPPSEDLSEEESEDEDERGVRRPAGSAGKADAAREVRDPSGAAEPDEPSLDEIRTHWIAEYHRPAELLLHAAHVRVARRQQREVLAALKQHLPEIIEKYRGRYPDATRRLLTRGDDLNFILPDQERWTRAFAAAVLPLLQRIVKWGAKYASKSLGVKLALSTAAAKVKAWLQLYASHHYASHVTQTTIDQLREVLTEGIATGQSLAEITAGVSAVFHQLTTTRATAAARTVATAALNAGTGFGEEIATSQGLRYTGQWISQEDDRVRPTHVEAHGQYTDKSGHFVVGGHRCKHPGDSELPIEERINCRCHKRLVPERSSEDLSSATS